MTIREIPFSIERIKKYIRKYYFILILFVLISMIIAFCIKPYILNNNSDIKMGTYKSTLALKVDYSDERIDYIDLSIVMSNITVYCELPNFYESVNSLLKNKTNSFWLSNEDQINIERIEGSEFFNCKIITSSEEKAVEIQECVLSVINTELDSNHSFITLKQINGEFISDDGISNNSLKLAQLIIVFLGLCFGMTAIVGIMIFSKKIVCESDLKLIAKNKSMITSLRACDINSWINYKQISFVVNLTGKENLSVMINCDAVFDKKNFLRMDDINDKSECSAIILVKAWETDLNEMVAVLKHFNLFDIDCKGYFFMVKEN